MGAKTIRSKLDGECYHGGVRLTSAEFLISLDITVNWGKLITCLMMWYGGEYVTLPMKFCVWRFKSESNQACTTTSLKCLLEMEQQNFIPWGSLMQKVRSFFRSEVLVSSTKNDSGEEEERVEDNKNYCCRIKETSETTNHNVRL